jgi:hypothetical protein
MIAMVKILFFRMTDDVWSSKMMDDGEDTFFFKMMADGTKIEYNAPNCAMSNFHYD